MKRLALLASLLAFAGCQNAPSKLDGTTKSGSGAAPKAEVAVTTADHSGDVESRLRRLEEEAAKNAPAMGFLNQVYSQQKAQQDQQRREEHDPTATFAVNVDNSVKAGLVEGPNTAQVTIIEAFDFA